MGFCDGGALPWHLSLYPQPGTKLGGADFTRDGVLGLLQHTQPVGETGAGSKRGTRRGEGDRQPQAPGVLCLGRLLQPLFSGLSLSASTWYLPPCPSKGPQIPPPRAPDGHGFFPPIPGLNLYLDFPRPAWSSPSGSLKSCLRLSLFHPPCLCPSGLGTTILALLLTTAPPNSTFSLFSLAAPQGMWDPSSPTRD